MCENWCDSWTDRHNPGLAPHDCSSILRTALAERLAVSVEKAMATNTDLCWGAGRQGFHCVGAVALGWKKDCASRR